MDDRDSDDARQHHASPVDSRIYPVATIRKLGTQGHKESTATSHVQKRNTSGAPILSMLEHLQYAGPPPSPLPCPGHAPFVNSLSFMLDGIQLDEDYFDC